jgi:hypothetical protein
MSVLFWVFCLCFFFFLSFFLKPVSYYGSPGWPKNYDPPNSASPLLGLQACTTMPAFSTF